jgi:inorganic pyrophosphatase
MMTDDKGQDEKILAVPHPKLTRYYEKVQHYTDLPDILVDRIVHFFEHYKDLEPGKWVKIEGLHGPERAHELIRDAAARAKAQGA